MKWSCLVVLLFLSEVMYAQTWKLEHVVSVKQMCIQASAMEVFRAAINKDLAKGLEEIYMAIGGKENYPSYIDIYCSCKARSISDTYSYESYMLDTFKTEKQFIQSEKNKICAINAITNAEDLYDALQ